MDEICFTCIEQRKEHKKLGQSELIKKPKLYNSVNIRKKHSIMDYQLYVRALGLQPCLLPLICTCDLWRDDKLLQATS